MSLSLDPIAHKLKPLVFKNQSLLYKVMITHLYLIHIECQEPRSSISFALIAELSEIHLYSTGLYTK